MKQLVKDIIVPGGTRPYKLYFGSARGLKMNFDLRQGEMRRYLGIFEIELTKYVKRMWRPGLTTFDVGAADGYYSIVFANLTKAPVLALEPAAKSCDDLRKNLALNPATAHLVDVQQTYVGLDGRDGQISLDRLAQKAFTPDLVKIDIEGAEVDALVGASDILERRRPGLLIEVHGSDIERECLKILRSYDYSTTIVDQRRWLPEYRPIPHNRWLVAEGR